MKEFGKRIGTTIFGLLCGSAIGYTVGTHQYNIEAPRDADTSKRPNVSSVRDPENADDERSAHLGNSPDNPVSGFGRLVTLVNDLDSFSSGVWLAFKSDWNDRYLNGQTDQVEDQIMLSSWATRDPAGLSDWLATLPDSLRTRSAIRSQGFIALGDSSPETLAKFPIEQTDVISKLSRKDSIVLASALPPDSLDAFEANLVKVGIDWRENGVIEIAELNRSIRANGVSKALDDLSEIALNESDNITGLIWTAGQQLRDLSSENIDEVIETFENATWWGRSPSETIIAAKLVAGLDPEKAMDLTFGIDDSNIATTASGFAFGEWYKRDQDAALEYLPRSNIHDPDLIRGMLTYLLQTVAETDPIQGELIEHIERYDKIIGDKTP